jgi:hypothetical protein
MVGGKINWKIYRENHPSRLGRTTPLGKEGVRKLANLPNPLCIQTSISIIIQTSAGDDVSSLNFQP